MAGVGSGGTAGVGSGGTAGDGAHDYVWAGRLLASAWLRPAALAWLLAVRGRSLLAVRDAAGRSPKRRVREAGRAARIALTYARRRRRRDAVVALPVPGDIAVVTAAGHKVFDLHGCRVVTLAPRLTADEFREQVERALTASACPLAPAVRWRDDDRRRYEEEFLGGPPLLTLDTGLARIDDYVRVLSSIACALPPESVPSGEYAADRARAAAARLDQAVHASRDPAEAGAAASGVRAFVADVGAALDAIGERPVDLVLSHGDLHGGNISLVDGVPRVIDWELSGRRTLSYDLYLLLFRALSRRPPSDGVAVVDSARHGVAARLRADGAAVDVDAWLRAADTYRLLFYLEHLAPKQLRRPTEARLPRLRELVDQFRVFEGWVGGRVPGLGVPPGSPGLLGPRRGVARRRVARARRTAPAPAGSPILTNETELRRE